MTKKQFPKTALAQQLVQAGADKITHRPKFISGMDKEGITTLRKEFRESLTKAHKRCQVTGMSYGCIASHIKPLASCTSRDECVDPANGLLLCKTVDEVFDKGWISFDDDGSMMVSTVFKSKYRGDIEARIPEGWLSGELKLTPPSDASVASRQRSYMRHHRYNVFISKKSYRPDEGYTAAENYDRYDDLHSKDYHSEEYIQWLERDTFMPRKFRDMAKKLRASRRLETGIVYATKGGK
jgi:hypothetical protein